MNHEYYTRSKEALKTTFALVGSVSMGSLVLIAYGVDGLRQSMKKNIGSNDNQVYIAASEVQGYLVPDLQTGDAHDQAQ